MIVPLLRDRRQPDLVEAFVRAFLVAAARRTETPEIAAAPEQDHVDRAVGRVREQRLRHDSRWTVGDVRLPSV